MPHLKKMTVTGAEVRKGDVIGVREVANAKRGREWADLRDDADKRILRVRLDSDVEVGRFIKTDEEIEAERAEQAAQWMEREIRTLREELDSGLKLTPQLLLEELAKSDRPFGLLDHWTIDRLLRRQAEYDFFAQVSGILERWAEMAEEGKTPDAITKYRADPLMLAFALVVIQARARRTPDPLSRSTSTTANICEDLALYTADRWLDSFSHFHTKVLVSTITTDRDA